MVRIGPITGLIFGVAVLAAVSETAGLGAAGWVAGAVTALFVCVAVGWGLHRRGVAVMGPANGVTMARSALVAAVAALTVDSLHRPVPIGALVGIASVALVLDGVDGYVARRTGTSSALGARFDMEVDAFLILVLSVYVSGVLGPWVLVIGAMRYAFVLAMWVLPWMRRPLPPRFWRKVVAAVQGIVLVVAAAGLLWWPVTTLAVGAALALLVESFGRDILWLWARHSEAAPDMRPERVAPVAATPAVEPAVAVDVQ